MSKNNWFFEGIKNTLVLGCILSLLSGWAVLAMLMLTISDYIFLVYIILHFVGACFVIAFLERHENE